MSEARACAHVFSGRPDPTWGVEEEVVQQLEDLWAKLSDFHGSPPSPPGLGYRGCALELRDVAYLAYGGVVTRKRPSGRIDREDAFRQFERILLTSAPAGSFPEGILRSLDDLPPQR